MEIGQFLSNKQRKKLKKIYPCLTDSLHMLFDTEKTAHPNFINAAVLFYLSIHFYFYMFNILVCLSTVSVYSICPNNPDCCFSIIHGRGNKSLDLVASDSDTAATWVRGFKSLITVVQSAEKRRSDQQ